MRRQLVNSSAVRSVGYDPRSQTLEVEFVSGEVYRYLGVERIVYGALLRSDSLGRFVNERIKPRYASVHIGEA
ncbi:MAG TPA: KTSC domain-containing protein [Jiangellaceae bacterium]|nr:KTSC domain-containing protein [Jiangellaceae bacterium]